MELNQLLRDNIGRCAPDRISTEIQEKKADTINEAMDTILSKKTLKKHHNMLLSPDDVEAVNNDSKKPQDGRIQMASTSVTHVMAQT